MPVKFDILATLSYFDLFDYPLTQTEIFQFLRQSHSHDDVAEALIVLASENWVYKFEEFFSLRDDHHLISRRRKGNARAREMLKTAEKIASFLSLFPFVRGVGVSGSLSKNFADENSDIDFFIITAPNRLWLARTLMHFFKKFTFLFNKQDWFCMNYYVDEAALEIREKNIYTATEVATLLPLRGIRTFREFFNANAWSRNFLPNHTMKISYLQEVRQGPVKRGAEWLISHPFGHFFNHFFMKLTAWKWLKKTRNGQTNKRGQVVGLDATLHCAKPHPRNFQEKLVQAYEKKIVNLFQRFETRAKSIY